MPNTFRLWAAGVKFENHHTAGSACSPARGALVTGLYPHQVWLLDTRASPSPQPFLMPGFPTYGRLLRSRGYATPWVGKWHLSNAETPAGTYLEDYGFDGLTEPDPIGMNGEGAGAGGSIGDVGIADQAISWLSKATTAAPFCLTVSFVNPHDKEYFWAGIEGDRYTTLFEAAGKKPLIRYRSIPSESDPPPVGYPATASNWESAATLAVNKPSTQSFARELQQLVWGGVTDDPAGTAFVLADSSILPEAGLLKGMAPWSYWQRAFDMYTGVMSQVDVQIGRVLDAIPPSLATNTVVVFTSDHGDFSGAHGLVSGKLGTCYDEVLRVPLIVVDPRGQLTGDLDTVRDGLTSSVDITPMLASIAAGGTNEWMTGDLATLYGRRLDLVPLLKSATAPGRPFVLYTTDEYLPAALGSAPKHVIGVRTPGTKLGIYSNWRPGTTEIDPAGMELEYYDRTTPGGLGETDNTPDDPACQALMQLTLNHLLPAEFGTNLPGQLSATQERARQYTLDYQHLLDSIAIPDWLDGVLADVAGAKT